MPNKSTTVVPLKDMIVLDEVREVFHQTTGLALSFHYPGNDDYDFYPKNEKNGYCELIQSTPEGLKRCLESDCKALQRAKDSEEFCIYTCHAGLMNAVIPLVYKGQYIGAIFTGQIFTKPQDDASFAAIFKALNQLGIMEKPIHKEFSQIKILDEDTFLLGIRLLNFMANHILSVEDELYLQSELHRKEREILRYENEQMRLKNDFQKLSILVLKDKVDFRSNVSGSKAQNQQKGLLIKRAQEFIIANYSQPITLSDVASAVYLSPNYFSTVFKEVTGSNFSSYLNDIRMQEGKRFLRETPLPLKQIVEQVGFEDYNYFNKVFKRIVGIPPATYRDMFGGK